jgi:intein/homing endonuclease
MSEDLDRVEYPIKVDEEYIYKYVKYMLGYPHVEVEVTDVQLKAFLEHTLSYYSRLLPKIRWYSITAYAGVQEYLLNKDTIGYGIVKVLIPRLDPIAPLLLSSGPRLDIFGYKYCLTDDTLISLLDGRERSIRELYDEYGDREFWVYSCDKDGNVKPGRAWGIHQTGCKEKVIKVTLDNGKFIRCTPGHKFLMRDGSYKPAGELKPGDSLMPLYRRTRKVGSSKSEYELSRAGAEEQFTHRVVSESTNNGKCSYCGIELPDRKHTIRHHINFNNKDNRPINIQWVTYKEHRFIHSEFTKLWKSEDFRIAHSERASERMRKLWENEEFRDKMVEKARRRMAKQHKDPKFRELVNEAIKEKWKDPEYLKRQGEISRKTMKKLWDNTEFREKQSKILTELWKDPEFRVNNCRLSSERNRNKWKDEEFRAEFSKRHSSLMKQKWNDPEYRKRAVEAATTKESRSKRSVNTSKQMKDKWANDTEFRDRKIAANRDRLNKNWGDPDYKEGMRIVSKKAMHKRWGHTEDFDSCERCANNHKVISIEDAGYEDVWDFSVDKYHNFALNSGIYVSNSYPYRDICISGDTEILMVDNTKISLSTLYNSIGGKSFSVFSYDIVDKKVIIGNGHSLRETHKDASIIQINLSNGRFFKCTPDHKLLTNGLSYKEACKINNGEVLVGGLTVTSVIDAGISNVYDLTVDKYHNFKLACGVFVKNCELWTDYMYFQEAQRILSSQFDYEVLNNSLHIHPKPDESFPLTYASAFPRGIDSVPYDDVDWIKRHVLAQTKIAVGHARRKFQVPGAQTSQPLDGREMVNDGNVELQNLEEDLLRRTPPFPFYRDL